VPAPKPALARVHAGAAGTAGQKDELRDTAGRWSRRTYPAQRGL